jgi:hypothetical protein
MFISQRGQFYFLMRAYEEDEIRPCTDFLVLINNHLLIIEDLIRPLS